MFKQLVLAVLLEAAYLCKLPDCESPETDASVHDDVRAFFRRNWLNVQVAGLAWDIVVEHGRQAVREREAYWARVRTTAERTGA